MQIKLLTENSASCWLTKRRPSGWVEGDAKHSKAQYCPENAQIVQFHNTNCRKAEILLAAFERIWMQLKYWTRQVSSTQWEDYDIPFHACQRPFTSYQILPDNKRCQRQLHWLFKLRLLRQLLTYLPYSPSMKRHHSIWLQLSAFAFFSPFWFFPALLSRLT